MSPHNRLAEIEARLFELAEEAKILRGQIGANDKERAILVAEKKSIEDHIRESHEQVIVSDHAVVRYLERKYGFDVDEVRREILTPQVKNAVNVGAAGIKVHGGTFKIAGRTITTFIVPTNRKS